MRKVWISIIVCIILLASLVILYYIDIQNIRTKVISQLEEKFEFCEITKDYVNILSNTGNFWMNCNGRPFYVEYKNDNVSYEMNGWSWLENTSYWNELKEMCEVYYPENNTLRFFCYENGVPKLKYYSFDSSTFTLTKVKEENFIDTLTRDLKNKYNFISGCLLKNYSAKGTYSPSYRFNFSCDNQDYEVITNLNFVFIKPVVLTHDNIITTFKNMFGKEPELIGFKASSIFDFGNLTIDYSTNLFSLKSNENIVNFINEIGDKFLIDFRKTDLQNIEILKEDNLNQTGISYKIYKTNGGIINLFFRENELIMLMKKMETFHE